MSEKDERQAFEAWIQAAPIERSIAKFTRAHTSVAVWHGQYRSYETQLAWEAWLESANRRREAV